MKKSKPSAAAIEVTPQQMRALAAGEDKALDIKTLKARYGYRGDTSIYELVRRGLLPRPVKIGGSSKWLLSQIGAAA
jgi:predicted DNA-binding transcriptional regulator AlpA